MAEEAILAVLCQIRDELRGIRFALEAQVVEQEDAPGGPHCPHCGETDGESLEDTSTMRAGRRMKRITCLSCGKSFGPGSEEAVANG